MTNRQFPDEWYAKPYSWRMGFISGKWRVRTDRPANKLTAWDKTPPEPNPLARETQAWLDWEEGFRAGDKWRTEQDKKGET
jgi:hypothetical protein